MDFITINHWDQNIWEKAGQIYIEAFGEHSPKPEKIIRNMFKKQICFLHCLINQNGQMVGMALTGSIKGRRILLIDYLAIRKNEQGKGIGRKLFSLVREWALQRNDYDQILLEAECEESPENLARIDFWEKCGFQLANDYIHHYIWVPEPYMAMTLNLRENHIPNDGKTLFKYISSFHRESFRELKNEI